MIEETICVEVLDALDALDKALNRMQSCSCSPTDRVVLEIAFDEFADDVAKFAKYQLHVDMNKLRRKASKK